MAQIVFGPNRAYPSLPSVSGDAENHTIVLQAMHEALETHERRTKNVLDSFVRLGELVELGLVNVDGTGVVLAPDDDSDVDSHTHDGLYIRQDGTSPRTTGVITFGAGIQLFDAADPDDSTQSLTFNLDGTDAALSGSSVTALNVTNIGTLVFDNAHKTNYVEVDDTEVTMVEFTSAISDDLFADVVFQTTMEGTSGAMDATDTSTNAQAMTAYNGAVLTDSVSGPSGFGTTALDMTRVTNRCTNIGPTLADGTYDPGGSGVAYGNAFTIEAFLYLAALPNNLNAIELITTKDFTSGQNGWSLSVIGNSNPATAAAMRMNFNASSGGSTTYPGMAAVLDTGQWYHVAINRNSSNEINWWVDGVESSAAALPNAESRAPRRGTKGLFLGCQSVQTGTDITLVGGEQVQVNESNATETAYLGPVRLTMDADRYDYSDATSFTPPTGWGSSGSSGSFTLGDDTYATVIDGLTIDLSGPTTASSTLTVTGATTLSSTLDVTGASTLTGAVTASSTLDVTGASTLTGAVAAESTLNVTGVATFASSAVIGTTQTLTMSENGTDFTFAFSDITDLNVTGLTEVVLDRETSVAWLDSDTGENAFLSVTAGAAGAVGGDPSFEKVGFLLPFDGTDGDTFTQDLSLWNHPVTFFGTAQIDDAQSKFGGSSLLLDGNSDYLEIPNSDAFDLLDHDWTMEVWWRPASLPSASGSHTFFSHWNTQGGLLRGAGFQVYNNGGNYRIRAILSTTATAQSFPEGDNISPSVNTWYHVALCRDGGTLRYWFDGVAAGTDTSIGTEVMNFPDTPMQIGSIRGGSGQTGFVNGWLDDARYTNGEARYVTAFTPSTETHETRSPEAGDQYFDAVALLCKFEGKDGETYSLDDSRYNHDLTFQGTAQIDTAQSQFGGSSLLLDGNSDYIDLDQDTFRLGALDFALEGWFRLASGPSLGTSVTLMAQWETSGNQRAWSWDYLNIGGVFYRRFIWSTNGSSTASEDGDDNELSTDTWYHIAVSRDGNTITHWLDGVDDGNGTTIGTSSIFESSEEIRIGALSSSGVTSYLDAHVDSIRATVGAPRYTTAFTAPTTEFSANIATTDVKLELLFDGEDGDTSYTSDDAGARTVTFVGTAALDDAQRVHGNTALLLDGNSDYLTIPDSDDFNLAGDDFNCEMWVRWASDPGTGNSSFFNHWDSQTPANDLGWIFYHNSNALQFGYSTDGTGGTQNFLASDTFNPAVDTWYHLRWSRVNDVLYYYVDGASYGSNALSATIFNPPVVVRVGAIQTNSGIVSHHNGWIDSLRLVVGHGAARGLPVKDLAPQYDAAEAGAAASDDTFNVGATDKDTSLRGENITATNFQLPTATTTELEDATDPVNTVGKVAGTMIYNTTTGIVVFASGTGATDTWDEGDGTTEHTPS